MVLSTASTLFTWRAAMASLTSGFVVMGPASLSSHHHSLVGRRPNDSVLAVSFADDYYNTRSVIGDHNNEDAENNNAKGYSLQQSTFPECMVLSWECDVEAHIRQILKERSTSTTAVDQPLMVGVVGIPGSGKSTSCSVLTQSLADVGSCLLPVDGYHYSVTQLLEHENPDDVIYRRGAADTFDVRSLQLAMEQIRYSSSNNNKDTVIKLPGFDHARGDPEYDAHTFDGNQHKVVIVEGLYLLHDADGWENIKSCLDLTIFVDACVDTCIDRLKIRNQCIPGYTKEEIELRYDVVDRANAMTADKSRQYANWIVEGIASSKKR